jgi:saccharopine dehydrogenase-like NADP-dependent oxidoreductase
MEHRFLVEFEEKKVLFRSRLVEFGVPCGGTSAVSRLVSVPTALAADWICKNSHAPGFVYPMEEAFARDVLFRLEQEFSVKFVEEEEVVD